ncbi:UNVERIFIED_CONTAM: hypothetical protein HDU68_001574 [Siphonaria sp. JEL0065]|nr:hypothetical protein HDU68_001574 [Siphonaria sp. JEL0065]
MSLFNAFNILISLSLATSQLAAASPIDSTGSGPTKPFLTLTATSATLHVPTKHQWEANSGYCGELSMIQAGLLHGVYISQWDIRGNASPGVKQNDPTGKSQLLLGSNGDGRGKGKNANGQGNDVTAAMALGLTTVVWNASIVDSEKYVMWIKKQVVSGNPVTMALYLNDPESAKNEDEYDHIVAVTGIASTSPTNLHDFTNFHKDDILTFDDHGVGLDLFPDRIQNTTGDPLKFSFSFGDLIKKRGDAAAISRDLYSVPRVTGGKVWNYAVAVTGVADKNKDTYPIVVTTIMNHEPSKEMEDNNGFVGKRPAAVGITLTGTVYNLTPGVKYNLYTYIGGKDVGSGATAYQVASVPTGEFNANAKLAFKKMEVKIVEGNSFTFTEDVDSDEIRFYRAVLARAP